MNHTIEAVTERIRQRSAASRAEYLARIQRTLDEDPPRRTLSCGNLAHGFAACGAEDKDTIRLMQSANIGIVSAYNDMLSAHQPLAGYPDLIKQVAREYGCSAQVAGGVPAMCDGVTQGQRGMELSLFSRDVIAMATAISLSHNLFDAVMCLGVCDKIVPGMLIGALQFAHLPVVFVPAGPMPSGIPNKAKSAVRQRYAEGLADRDELLQAESASYHSPGTCTFYGTANTNQILLELMGLQLPGASFVNPGTALRTALTRASTVRAIQSSANGQAPAPLAQCFSEASLVNAIVGLLASGGSTNHTLHLIAIARCAGIDVNWVDFDDLSRAVPLLMRVYPNGEADVNAFQHAGGTAFLIRELRLAGLLNEDVNTVMGRGLSHYELAPELAEGGEVVWHRPVTTSADSSVLRPCSAPFDPEGGLRSVRGNLGDGVIKVSAVADDKRRVRASCRVFADQDSLKHAFDGGELNRDVVVVVRFQGPKANGMPELHKLTPYLGVLQDRGFAVALVTDGRMSGASGKVLAAIHVYPEALDNGPLAYVQDGDIVDVDANAGTLRVEVDAEALAARTPARCTHRNDTLGGALFESFRQHVGAAGSGASALYG